MRLPYQILDVFTDVPYAGNPLAVVLDGEDLSSQQMQALAQEFNLSETTFPAPPTMDERAEGADYRVRIFTPETEIPFAGHPSVGTAWLLAHLGRVGAGTVRQACGAGVVPLHVAEGPGRVELGGGTPTLGAVLETGPLLAALGLGADDLADAPPPRWASTGLAWAFLLVRPDAVARCQVDAARLRRELSAPGAPDQFGGLTVLSWDGTTAHARGFAVGIGVPEDPATGSAALALGAYLVGAGLLPGDGMSSYTVRQGIEMGRPSTLYGSVLAAEGAAESCHVAGDVVPVASGAIEVPGS